MQNLIVLKPYILSIKNWWRKREFNVATLFQDLIVIFLLVVLLVAIFTAGKFTLLKIVEFSNITYLSATNILSIILFFLFFMSFFSSLAINIGVFFFSADSSLLMASPIKSYKLYFGKSLLVFIAASWMPIFFIFPFVLSFAYVFKSSLFFLLPAMGSLVLLFLLSNIVAQITALLLMKFSFLWKRKTILLVIPVVIIVLIYLISSLLYTLGGDGNALLAFSKIYKTLEFSKSSLLPSKWVAKIIGDLLEFRIFKFSSELALLLSSNVFFALSAYFLWELNSSNINQVKQATKLKSNEFSKLSSLLKTFKFSSSNLSFIVKDFLLLSRDIAQLMQIAVLSFLCFLYLSHVELLQSLNFFPPDKIVFWRNLLSISNVLIATFFCTAICTRLVFPSVSLEGKSYWIVKTSPISSYHFLKNKLNFWFPPLALILALFLGLGSYLLKYNTFTILVYFVLAFFLAYAIVGLAIGLGAKYANFNFEYSSQMAMSFGSFIFMLLSVGISVVIQIPFLILLNLIHKSNFSLLPSIIGNFGFICLLYFLYKIGIDSINFGAKSLDKRGS